MIVTHDEQDLTLRIRQLRWEAEGVVSVQLEDPNCADLPTWALGAHIDLHLPGDISRQYSLCGRPSDQQVWRIGALREPISRGGSAAVHETLRPGDLVRVVGPRNHFALAASPDYLFIAGGIGITPLIPMIEQVAAAGAQWRLVYGGRELASMAFVRDLQAEYDGHARSQRRGPRPRSTSFSNAPESPSRSPQAPRSSRRSRARALTCRTRAAREAVAPVRLPSWRVSRIIATASCPMLSAQPTTP